MNPLVFKNLSGTVKDVKGLVADIDNRLVRMIQRMNLQSFREVVDEIGPSTDPEYRKFTEILKGCEGWLLQENASDSHEEFRQKLPGMFSTIPNGVKENEQMRYDMTEHCVDIAIPAMRRGAMLPPTSRERTNTGTPRSTRGGGSVPNVCTPQSSNPYTAQTHGLVDWAPHPSYMGRSNPTYMGSSNPVMPTRGAAPTDQQTSYNNTYVAPRCVHTEPYTSPRYASSSNSGQTGGRVTPGAHHPSHRGYHYGAGRE